MKTKKFICTVLVLFPSFALAKTAAGSSFLSNLTVMAVISLGLIMLLITLYYLSKSLRIYGGKIGKGLDAISVGIFIVSLKEIVQFIKIFFDYNIMQFLIRSDIAEFIFQNGTNLLVFTLFAYGFYGLSGIMEKK